MGAPDESCTSASNLTLTNPTITTTGNSSNTNTGSQCALNAGLPPDRAAAWLVEGRPALSQVCWSNPCSPAVSSSKDCHWCHR